MSKFLFLVASSLLISAASQAASLLPDMSGEWVSQSTRYTNGVTSTQTDGPMKMENGLEYYLPNFTCDAKNECSAGHTQSSVQLKGTLRANTVVMSGEYFDASVGGIVIQQLTVAWGTNEGKDFVTINVLEFSKETGELTAIGTDTFHRP